jgi:hypothetical protein
MANATHSKSDDFALRPGAPIHPELPARPGAE